MSSKYVLFNQFIESRRKAGKPITSLDIWRAALIVAQRIAQDVQGDYEDDETSSGYEAAGVIRQKIEQCIKGDRAIEE